MSLRAFVPAFVVAVLATLTPPRAFAVPSYARQTALPCSACHTTPPELNSAGRRFKLLGYVDKDATAKELTADSGPSHGGFSLPSFLPVSVLFETSFTATHSPQPGTQNGNFEFPQDVSLFLAGAWTKNLGSFVQMTYSTADDHFTIDNTDVRYARTGTLGGKELVYGVTLNNNPSVEDLWHATPAWGFPWIASDAAPTPTAGTIMQGALATDVAGLGGYAMWNDHLYVDATLYRSDHVGVSQPNPGSGASFNIRGVAPYWRIAWQESTPTTQFEIGTYGIHMKSSPGAVVGLEDTYTDWAVDVQYDLTVRRRDLFSLRGTYIHETSDLAATFAAGGAQQSAHRLSSATVNAEYHLGNRYSGTIAWFDTWGTSDPLLYVPGAVSGNLNGDPGSAGYIANLSVWPTQNWQLALQYIGYTRFNGGKTDYDGAGRSASDNNTVYLLARVLF